MTACTVEGYCSDVTRTGIFGKPSEKQNSARVRNRSQSSGRGSRRRSRRKILRLSRRCCPRHRHFRGYGPGYKFFAHRLGHASALDIHEHPYLVHASNTVLEPGNDLLQRTRHLRPHQRIRRPLRRRIMPGSRDGYCWRGLDRMFVDVEADAVAETMSERIVARAVAGGRSERCAGRIVY